MHNIKLGTTMRDSVMPKYRIISRRIVPSSSDIAIERRGQHAILVKLDDGRQAWGFGSELHLAEDDAITKAAAI